MPDQSEASNDFVSAVEYEIDKNQEIQGFIDVNELQTSTKHPFIAAVEHKVATPSRLKISSNWTQSYTLPNGKYLKDDGSSLPVRECREISALEAVAKGLFEGDIRPKLYDKNSKSWTLLDSGSVVSCVPKGPNDVIDTQVQLRSVNGGQIATFGTEEIEIKIGRNPYRMQVIKADIPQTFKALKSVL